MKPITNWKSLLRRAARHAGGACLALAAAFPAQAAISYTFQTTTFAWHDPIASGDTRIANWNNACSGFCDTIGDDSVSAPLNLGFTFNFAGTNYTQLQVQTDGRVMFNNNYSFFGTQSIGNYALNPSPPPPLIWSGAPGSQRTYTLTPLPQGPLNNTMVVYGTDVDVSPSGSGGGPSRTGCSAAANTPTAANNYLQGPCGIYYQQVANGCGPGCGQFVVTWLNVPDWGDGTSTYTFQVMINQNGTFAYQWNTSVNPEFGQAEVGYQGASAADYVNFNYPPPTSPYSGGISALAGTAILWGLVPNLGCPKLNAFESTTPALAGCGLINTKVAGSTFSLNLAAVTPFGLQDNTFSGAVSVDLVGNTSPGVVLNANYCPISFTALMASPINVNFIAPNDRVNVNFPAIADVWKDVRVRIVYGGTTYCSNDNFAIRPASLTVSGFDNTWTTPGNARPLNNISINGGNVHQAGMPFRLAASAFNAGGAGVSQYNGSPTVVAGTCVAFDALGCNAAYLKVPGGPTWTAGNPLTNDSAIYSEAGALTLQVQDFLFAGVDGSDNEPFATFAVPVSPAASIGRFVPASFTVTAVPVATAPAPQFATFGVPDSSCNAAAANPKRTFTYIGQPFGYVAVPANVAPVPKALVPQMQITALNATGATTTNYRGVLWKIAATPEAIACSPATTCTAPAVAPLPGPGAGYISQVFTSVGLQAFDPAQVGTIATPGTLGQPVLTLANGVNKYPYSPPALATVILYGNAALSSNIGDMLAFTRNPGVPVAPFNARIMLNVTVTDNTEVLGGTITTSGGGATFIGGGTGITFDGGGSGLPAAPTGSEMRFGRMRVDNANGSELLPLQTTVRAEYFNANGAFISSGDNCTTLAAANIARGNFQPAAVAAATPSFANGIFLNGTNTLKFSAPGAGNTGSFNMAINLDPAATVTPTATCLPIALAANTTGAGLVYLQNLQCLPASSYIQDPSARITFGIFNANPKTIYMRENY